MSKAFEFLGDAVYYTLAVIAVMICIVVGPLGWIYLAFWYFSGSAEDRRADEERRHRETLAAIREAGLNARSGQ